MLDQRTFWWNNGRLAGANLQHSNGVLSNMKLCGDNALPENFGDLTEISYLDIGLYNNITRLPESIGNLFHYSIYELVDRNGGYDANIQMLDGNFGSNNSFEWCRDKYNNLKWWPDNEYSWEALNSYLKDPSPSDDLLVGGCGESIFTNIHLDGNSGLGLPGSIPTSINNWKELSVMYQGFGVENMELPINWTGWKLYMLLNGSGQTMTPDFAHDITLCSVIPNLANSDMMNTPADNFMWSYFSTTLFGGSNNTMWSGETCLEYWETDGGIEYSIYDFNVDGDINVLDIITFITTFLQVSQDYGPGSVPISEFEGYVEDYENYDLNGDGFVNVMDAVILVQMVINDPSTTSAQRQQLQKQLRRLDGIK